MPGSVTAASSLPRAAHRGCALLREDHRVEPPHEAGDRGDEHQHRAEIEAIGEQQAQHPRADQKRQRAVTHLQQHRIAALAEAPRRAGVSGAGTSRPRRTGSSRVWRASSAARRASSASAGTSGNAFSVIPYRPAARRGTLPGGSRRSPPVSCVSCLLSASRAACACARCRRRSTSPARSCAAPSRSRAR